MKTALEFNMCEQKLVWIKIQHIAKLGILNIKILYLIILKCKLKIH